MTAQQITLKSVKEDRPLVLKDVLNKGIGSTVFQTDNQYERELFTGIFHARVISMVCVCVTCRNIC